MRPRFFLTITLWLSSFLSAVFLIDEHKPKAHENRIQHLAAFEAWSVFVSDATGDCWVATKPIRLRGRFSGNAIRLMNDPVKEIVALWIKDNPHLLNETTFRIGPVVYDFTISGHYGFIVPKINYGELSRVIGLVQTMSMKTNQELLAFTSRGYTDAMSYLNEVCTKISEEKT